MRPRPSRRGANAGAAADATGAPRPDVAAGAAARRGVQSSDGAGSPSRVRSEQTAWISASTLARRRWLSLHGDHDCLLRHAATPALHLTLSMNRPSYPGIGPPPALPTGQAPPPRPAPGSWLGPPPMPR